MKIAIVYDSSTGTTAKAAEAMGKTLEGNGHQVRVQSVVSADPADVSEADLVCVGGWVKGLFIIMQHPSGNYPSENHVRGMTVIPPRCYIVNENERQARTM